MIKHKYFNLYQHETEELEDILQVEIVERQLLHQWPLSSVELIRSDKNQKWIYKTQYGPTVEADFYETAKSELLVPGRILHKSNIGHSIMLFDFINGILLENLNLQEDEVIKVGRNIIECIAKIDGALPHYLDIRTESKWIALMQKMLENLRYLVSKGKFVIVDDKKIDDLKMWMFSKEVMTALAKNIGYVHNDFQGENIFMVADGYRVIDWQRPIWGPKELDLALLLESLDIDMLKHIDIGTYWIMCLLRIEWFTDTAIRWFPDGCETYDKTIAHRMSMIEKSAQPQQ